MEQHSRLSDKNDDNGEEKKVRSTKEDEIVESIEFPAPSHVKESDKELYANFMKDGVHNFPFDMVHSDEESEEDENEGGKEERKGAMKRKRDGEGEGEGDVENGVERVKRAKIEALWRGFGEEGEFCLRSGRLYDPREWDGKDWSRGEDDVTNARG